MDPSPGKLTKNASMKFEGDREEVMMAGGLEETNTREATTAIMILLWAYNFLLFIRICCVIHCVTEQKRRLLISTINNWLATMFNQYISDLWLDQFRWSHYVVRKSKFSKKTNVDIVKNRWKIVRCLATDYVQSIGPATEQLNACLTTVVIIPCVVELF